MIGQASSSDVDAAVAAARQALGPWQALGGEGRLAIFMLWHGRCKSTHGFCR